MRGRVEVSGVTPAPGTARERRKRRASEGLPRTGGGGHGERKRDRNTWTGAVEEDGRKLQNIYVRITKQSMTAMPRNRGGIKGA